MIEFGSGGIRNGQYGGHDRQGSGRNRDDCRECCGKLPGTQGASYEPDHNPVYDDALRPLGITASQFTLLTTLAKRDSITAVEIGHALDIEKSTLSRNLKRLLALGHITMDPPAGRRGRGLHLTMQGKKVITDAFPIWRTAQMRAESVMGVESREMLDGMLDHAERLPVAR